MLPSIQYTQKHFIAWYPNLLFQKLLFYQANSKAGQLSKQIRGTNLQNWEGPTFASETKKKRRGVIINLKTEGTPTHIYGKLKKNRGKLGN